MRRFLQTLSVVCSCAVCIAPAFAQDAQTIDRLEVGLRIGTQPSTEYELGSLRYGFALTPDGGVIIPVTETANLRQFDSTGRFVQIVGRRGNGPGEFQAIRNAGYWADTLWVIDRITRRVTMFPPRRNLITLPINSFPPSASIASILRNRALVFAPVLTSSQLLAGQRIGSISIQDPNTHKTTYDREVLVGSTVLAMESGGGQGTVRRERLEQALSQDGLVAVSPNGNAVAVVDRRVVNDNTTPLTIEILDDNGSRTSSFTIDRQPVKVSGAFVSAQLDTIASHIQKFRPGQFASQSAAKSFVATQLKLPATYPRLSGVIIEDDRTVWIADPLRDRQPGELPAKPRDDDRIVWRAYDASGRPKRSVSVPIAVTLVSIRGTNFWGSATDESGVPVVVRLRKR